MSRLTSKRTKALVYSIFIDEYSGGHAAVLKYPEKLQISSPNDCLFTEQLCKARFLSRVYDTSASGDMAIL